MNKQLHLTLCTALLSATAAVQAQDATAQYESIKGVVTAISPNGKYVVGNRLNVTTDMLSSFVWNADTKEQTWQTSYDENDFDKSGKYLYVNDSGTIVGAMKDKNLKRDFPGDDWSDPYTYYFMNATVWRNGKATKLGIGNHTTDEFDDEFDGSYATSITADGNTIVGYIYKGYVPNVPCGWKYNATKDTYEYYEYTLPTLDGKGCINGISADGKVAVGAVAYNGARRPIVWTSPDECEEIDLGIDAKDSWGGEAAAISPNGRYALIYVNAKKAKLAVYDIENAETIDVPLTNSYNVKGLAIDDHGNFFCTIQDDKNYETKPYYYAAASKQLISMDYFMESYAPELTGKTPLGNSSMPVAISADGSAVVGYQTINLGSGTSASSSWWLKFDNQAFLAPSVTGVRLYPTGLEKLAIAWQPVSLPEGMTLKEYEVYADGDLVATLSAQEAAGLSVLKTYISATPGDHKAYVKAICEKKGVELSSDASETASYTVPTTYAMPMTEDFESQGFTANDWQKELVSGNTAEVLMWNVSGGNAYDYENSSYFASVTSISKDPFQATLTSRFLDARQVKNPYLVINANLTYVNEVPTNLKSDFFDVEYTTDGEAWTLLHRFNAEEMTPYVWNFYKLDLADLGGKAFQVRFNAHGEGKAQLRWAIDHVTVGSELTTAPEGMKAVKTDGQVDLSWKNEFGAYEETYLTNSNVIPVYNIGNGGQPLITAVDMPAKRMAAHVGEYITSVSSFIYDDTSMESPKLTQAEAIVYEDGKEVSRQAFDENVALNPFTSTVALQTPVQIKAGKNYRIAVRIHDYDGQQNPLYYQASTDYIAGTTDLYSEDEGKTWQTIYDFNKDNADEARAWCIWPIRANITAEATAPAAPQLDQALRGYNVYRNGVQLNDTPIYADHKQFVDKLPVDGATYTVQAFYTDGRVSAQSEPCTITVSAIHDALAQQGVGVSIDKDNQSIRISGQPDRAVLVNANGQTVATTSSASLSTAGLDKGVYILAVTKGGKKATYKMVIR